MLNLLRRGTGLQVCQCSGGPKARRRAGCRDGAGARVFVPAAAGHQGRGRGDAQRVLGVGGVADEHQVRHRQRHAWVLPQWE